MNTRTLTPPLSRLAVESRALTGTPYAYVAQYPMFPLARVGRGRGAVAKWLYARALAASRTGVVDPLGDWPSPGRRPIDLLLGGVRA